jgi:hypothetical protein
MNMKTKYLLAYDLPMRIDAETRKVTLALTNTSEHELRNLEVALNSLDGSALRVLDREVQIAELIPGETKTVTFAIAPKKSASVYVSVSGWKPKRFFHWESAAAQIKVDRDGADSTSLTEPTPQVPSDKVVRFETTIKSLASDADIEIAFWAQDPTGNRIQLAELDPEPIPKGERASYAVEFTPQQKGIYTIYARLEGETQQSEHKITSVRVR